MEAYVTLVATDSYAAGALVLAHRLRDHGSKKDIVCLVTPEISANVRKHLSRVCILVPVDTLRSSDEENLRILGRPELDITFTKIHLWRLTQYSKVVFLDADTLPLRNIDELFDREEFAAAPDAGWPDCFNSGVFVTVPSENTYAELQDLATSQGSFDGGDQGLLNSYFSSWAAGSPSQRLPFIYNATPTTQYSYAPAHYHFGRNIAVTHFIGLDKPWKWQRFADGKILPRGNSWQGLSDLVQSWWDTWNLHYGQIAPHMLFSHTFSSALDGSYHREPVELFDISGLNAWDTQRIKNDLQSSTESRQQHVPMPPLSGVTLSHPQWLPEEEYRIDDIHRPVASHQSVQENPLLDNDDRSMDASAVSDTSSVEESTCTKDENEFQYSMIEWNPAHQPPPDNKVDVSDLPDLTGFVNAWDLPTDKQTVWVAPEHHQEMGTNEDVYQAFPWETRVEEMHHPSRIWLHDSGQYNSPAPDSDEYIQAQMNKIVDDLEATTVGYHDNNGQHKDDTLHYDIPIDQSDDTEHHHAESEESQNRYAMDAIVSTVSPGRSPFLSFLQDELLDGDWSARDMIPIPLKLTSKLTIDSPRSATPRSPRSPRSPRRFFLEGAPRQSSRLYAQQPNMFSKKTPYSSVATTPVAEKGVYFGDDELYGREGLDQSASIPHGRDFLFSADYSIDKPLSTLRRENRSTQQSEGDQKTEGQWDTNMALEELKRKSESMIMTKVLEGDEETRTGVPPATESTEQCHVQPVIDTTLAEVEVLDGQEPSLSLMEPITAAATLLEVELDLSKSGILKRRTMKSSTSAPLPDLSTAEKPDMESVNYEGKDTMPAHIADDSYDTHNESFIAYFDDSVIQIAQKKLQALIHSDSAEQNHSIDDGGPPQPIDKKILYPTQTEKCVNDSRNADFGSSNDEMKADLEVLSIQMPDEEGERSKGAPKAEAPSEATVETLTTKETRMEHHDCEQSTSSSFDETSTREVIHKSTSEILPIEQEREENSHNVEAPSTVREPMQVIAALDEIILENLPTEHRHESNLEYVFVEEQQESSTLEDTSTEEEQDECMKDIITKRGKKSLLGDGLAERGQASLSEKVVIEQEQEPLLEEVSVEQEQAPLLEDVSIEQEQESSSEELSIEQGRESLLEEVVIEQEQDLFSEKVTTGQGQESSSEKLSIEVAETISDEAHVDSEHLQESPRSDSLVNDTERMQKVDKWESSSVGNVIETGLERVGNVASASTQSLPALLRRESRSRTSTTTTTFTASAMLTTSATYASTIGSMILDTGRNTTTTTSSDNADTSDVVYLSETDEDASKEESVKENSVISMELLSEDEDTTRKTRRSHWSKVVVWVSDEEEEST